MKIKKRNIFLGVGIGIITFFIIVTLVWGYFYSRHVILPGGRCGGLTAESLQGLRSCMVGTECLGDNLDSDGPGMCLSDGSWLGDLLTRIAITFPRKEK